jgi:hypothetical protein
MDGLTIGGMLCRGKEDKGWFTGRDWVGIGLYDGLQRGSGGVFVQDRTPQWLGLVLTGKVGHLHSRADQKCRDDEGYEANASTMS